MSRYILSLYIILFSISGIYAGSKNTRDIYGPVLSTHMAADERTLGSTRVLSPQRLGNFVFRGRVISLDPDRSINLCFDTEHMRIAAAWSGGYINWRGPSKNMGPAIDGDILFSTKIGPGWSHDGLWEDPRHPKEGPLPKQWAKFKGMYLHGRKVILSYTVDDCPILEMPSAETQDSVVAIVRNFHFGCTAEPLGLLVCEEEGSNGGISNAGDNNFRHRSEPAEGSIAALQVKGGHILARTVGAPKGSTFEVADGKIFLKFPARTDITKFQLLIARVPNGKEKIFADLKVASPKDLKAYTKGGPQRWPQVLKSKGELGAEKKAYVVDNIPEPKDNPWGVKFRFGALDFFEDGRAALSTWEGDVWIVSGLDKDLESVTWRRYAAGLQQPLGLKIVDGVIYTAGRDQVTRLHDFNQDGEADFYENFNNDAGLTPQRHEFVMDLETDAEGNFYYCRSGHYLASLRGENCCVMKLTPDGTKLEVVARGLREPNGMAISPDGLITVGDNEGNGIPQTPIYQVRKGAYFGYKKSIRHGEKMPVWSKAMLWLPKNVDRSAGSQAWVTSEKWGPLSGHMIHTSYGHCRLFHIMLDREGKELQAAATQFPLYFSSGIMRARIHPKDGQVYLCGLRGWDTAASRDGQFCRVRYTGEPLYMPLKYHVTNKGIQLTFAVPLDPKMATNTDNWSAEWYSVGFGNVKSKRKEFVNIKKVELSNKERTVDLHFESIEPVTNLNLQYRIPAADGKIISGTLYGTINAVPE